MAARDSEVKPNGESVNVSENRNKAFKINQTLGVDHIFFINKVLDSNPRKARDKMSILMLKLYIMIMYNIRYT